MDPLSVDVIIEVVFFLCKIPDPYWMENDASYIQEHCYDSTSLESWSAEGDVKVYVACTWTLD